LTLELVGWLIPDKLQQQKKREFEDFIL